MNDSEQLNRVRRLLLLRLGSLDGSAKRGVPTEALLVELLRQLDDATRECVRLWDEELKMQKARETPPLPELEKLRQGSRSESLVHRAKRILTDPLPPSEYARVAQAFYTVNPMSVGLARDVLEALGVPDPTEGAHALAEPCRCGSRLGQRTEINDDAPEAVVHEVAYCASCGETLT